MIGTAQVIRADSRDLPLADNSVDLVVTSPPYFALRSYQDGGAHYAGQVGSEATPADFVDALLDVTEECMRVLKPSGSLWVNLGDKYSTYESRPGKAATHEWAEKSQQADRYTKSAPDAYGIKYKSLMGIPWRYALRCIDDLGLILRAEVIWSKPNGLPESVTDRVRRSHEQWFHFTLEPRYFSAVDEIREAHTYPGDQRHLRNTDRDATPGKAYTINGALNPLGKLPGSVWTVPTEPLRVPDRLGIDHFAAFPTEWPRRIIQGWSPAGICVECGEGRRPVTDVAYELDHISSNAKAFDLARVAKGSGHHRRGKEVSRRTSTVIGYTCACIQKSALFHDSCQGAASRDEPDSMCDDCYDRHHGLDGTTATPIPPTRPAVVLDPFGGTGTTAMVAKALGRHGISVDMSADYCRLAEWRTNDRNQLAKVLGIEKAEPAHEGEQSLLDLIDGGAA